MEITLKDDYEKIDREFWANYEKELVETRLKNDDILTSIENDFGSTLATNIKGFINDGEFLDFLPLEIVDKTKGKYQKESEYEIDVHVNQSGPGISGDDYHGEVYIHLPNGKYLMMQY